MLYQYNNKIMLVHKKTIFFLLNIASTPKQKNEISGIKVELAGGGTLRSVLVAQHGEENHL